MLSVSFLWLCYAESLLGFAIAAKHFDDFVLVELSHLIASGTAVLAWVELAWFLSEDFAHRSCEGEAAVAVDIDFAHGALCGLAELLLGDTYCIGHLASVSVDDVNILLWN